MSNRGNKKNAQNAHNASRPSSRMEAMREDNKRRGAKSLQNRSDARKPTPKTSDVARPVARPVQVSTQKKEKKISYQDIYEDDHELWLNDHSTWILKEWYESGIPPSKSMCRDANGILDYEIWKDASAERDDLDDTWRGDWC